MILEHDYDNIFISYEDVNKINNYDPSSVESITNNMLLVFFRENKKDIVKDLSSRYKLDFNRPSNLIKFNDSLTEFKRQISVFFIDVYYSNKTISKNLKEDIYIKYAQKKASEYIKKKIIDSVK